MSNSFDLIKWVERPTVLTKSEGMLNFLNVRNLLIISACVTSGYVLSTSLYELLFHVDNSLSDVQDLTGFSRPITDLFFEDVDPSDPDVRELLSYGVT